MNVNKNEAYDREAMNPDAYPMSWELIDNFYGPIYKLIEDGKFDEAKKTIDELDADLAEFEATNNKRRFFRYPRFMIDGQKREMQALHRAYDRAVAKAEAEAPALAESYAKEGNHERCENCGTLLNDMGTCPKCDDGEEDYRDLDEAIHNHSSLPDEIEDEIYYYVIDEFRGNAPSNSFDKLLDELEDIEFDHEAARRYYGELVDTYTNDTESLEVELELLNESLLTEGPKLRALGRKIANKFDPAGARDREVGGHKKDENSHRAKQAPKICARDFTTAAQGNRFYPNKKNTKVMNYDEWCDAYGTVTPADENSYAEWYNAIVTDDHGFYIRRGSEDLHNKGVRFVPEQNDDVLRMYRVSPYVTPADQALSAVGAKAMADAAERARADSAALIDAGNTAEAELDKRRKEEEAAAEEDAKTDTVTDTPDGTPVDPKEGKKTNKTKKAGVAVADKDMKRFYTLCRLTSLRVYDKSGNELNLDDIRTQINKDNLADFKVNTQYGRMSSLATWFQAAIKSNFLSKINEYLEYNYGNLLNEDLLTEAPVLKLDPDQLMDPEKIDMHDVMARSAEREKKAELAEKEDAVREILLSGNDTLEVLEELSNVLVPDLGKADSVAGELVRAINRLLYRDNNDGDKFFSGYGIETCGGPAMYLYNNGFDRQIDSIIEDAYDISDDDYTLVLFELANDIFKEIAQHPELISSINNVDSYKCNTTYLEENQPTYDFTIEGTEEVYQLRQNGVVDNSDITDYVRQSLRNNGIKNFEITAPWSRYSTEVEISGLDGDAYDFIKDELCSDLENFWLDFVDEHESELDEPEEEFEECLAAPITEALTRGCILTGSEIITTACNNDTTCECYNKLNDIAKTLHVDKPKDLVCYIDSEWLYDPTLVDNTHWMVPAEPTYYEVNHMPVVGEIVDNDLWLYFTDTKACNKYLEYLDNYS